MFSNGTSRIWQPCITDNVASVAEGKVDSQSLGQAILSKYLRVSKENDDDIIVNRGVCVGGGGVDQLLKRNFLSFLIYRNPGY